MESSGSVLCSGQLTAGEKSTYAVERRLGGPQNYCGHGGEEKSLYLCWEINPISLIVELVA
jgi:hypothetical protein